MYESGSGWPAFSNTIDGVPFTTSSGRPDIASDAVQKSSSRELVCSRCGLHLGHRFRDGPPPSGVRDCINSACLHFVEDGQVRRSQLSSLLLLLLLLSSG